MDDERTEAGLGGVSGVGATGSTADPEPADKPLLAPAADQAARDAEFTLFYIREMPALVAFLIWRGIGATLAADIAQDTMFAAYRSWNDLDAPRGWVRKVALRTWGKVAPRHHAEQPHEHVPEPSGVLSPNEAAELVQRHDVLDRLEALPEAQREVMALVFDGYQPTEIAGLLEKNPGTVRSLLRQARTTLQAQSAATEEEPG
ncbi:RNA polymerase sigma factor [Dactylosporangium sp. NPDC048998]|uniref:RNA polymerase sigma factor n=1 Tax=Dactylosporangium sp. NPDC048998 TaxID=3363976 RepID=UPI0037120BC2